MIRLLLGFLSLFIFQSVSAQKVQWASELVRFSSEHSSTVGAAREALGPPNMMANVENPLELAWTPGADYDGGESIEVRFKYAMNVSQIAICESLNPGAIYKIFLIDTKGKNYKVYENKNPSKINTPINWFRHKISRTPYRVIGLKLVLKTKNVAGRQQIDAIAISDSSTPIENKVDALRYSSPPGRPENLGRQVNSAFSERQPIISPDGKTLYFTRKFHPDNKGKANYDDIWVSQLTKAGQWSSARNIGTPLNDDNHNFVFGVSPDGDRLYLGNDYKRRTKNGVSISQYRGEWAFPSSISIGDHYNKSAFVGYTVSVKENVILMAVNRDEGFGDRDIYVSFKQGKTWSKPRNLGPVINTPGMESNVFLAADEKTLYFASAGHAGYGGLDMFVTRRLDNSWTKWSTPKNLGNKINSPGNDFHYSIPAAGDYAYFSSDFNSYGQSDLFRIRLPREARPEPVKLIKSKLIDATTNKPIENQRVVSVVKATEKRALPSVKGYYAVPKKEEDNVVEELDYDGDDEVVKKEIAEAKKEAEKKKEEPVVRTNPEIEALKKRLANLDKNLEELEKERPEEVEEPELDWLERDDDEPYVKKENPKKQKRIYEIPPSVENKQTDIASATQGMNEIDMPGAEQKDYSSVVEEDDYLKKLRDKYNTATAASNVTQVAAKEYEVPTAEGYGVQDYDKSSTDAEIQAQAAELKEGPDAETQQKLDDMAAAEQNLKSTRDAYNQREIDNLQQELANTKRKAVKRVEAKEVGDINKDQYRVNKEIPDVANKKDNKEVSYDKYRDIGKVRTKEEILADEAKQKQKDEDKEDLDKLKALLNKSRNNTEQAKADKAPELSPEQQAKVDRLKALDEQIAQMKKYKDGLDAKSGDPVEETEAPKSIADVAENKYKDQEEYVIKEPESKTPQKPIDRSQDLPAKADDNSDDVAAAKRIAELEKQLADLQNQRNDAADEVATIEVPTERPSSIGETKAPKKTPKKENTSLVDSHLSNTPAQTTPEKEYVVVRPSFDEIKSDVKEDLKKELIEDVQRELHDELLAELQNQIRNELDTEIKDQLEGDVVAQVEDELRKDLESQIRDDLEEDLKDDVRQELRDEMDDDIRNEVRDELRSELEDDVRQDVTTELKDELREQVEKELRENLQNDIKEQLKNELRDPIKEQLKKEMEYRLKKELERKLRAELEKKIRAQVEQQYRDALADRESNPSSTEPDEYVELEEDVLMVPIKVGAIIPLSDVYFEANKFDLKEQSINELERAYEFLVGNPNVIVEIGGHTNSLCSTSFAAELSKGRSKEVKDWLVEKGIPERQIEYHGYGKLKPIADNTSVAGRRKNQRVEMKILEILEE